MAYAVDFVNVSTVGLESSPVADALAGLRANEARYFKNKYDFDYVTTPAAEQPELLAWIETILREERGIEIASAALEIADVEVDGIRWPEVYYQSGLVINVLWTIEDGGKRAVGFKLSEGMEAPEELGAFKFARQRSKLAGEIRGTFFVIKGAY